MVAPAFGFSAGDFLAAGGLIVKICKSLRAAGGAASEYQQVIIELQGLQRCLNHLQALEPDEYNIARVNALRGMASSVKIPLEEFLGKLQQYEVAMGPFASRGSLHGAPKKAKWAVTVTEEVNKFRAIIVAKTVSINLLIGIHNSEGITGVARTQKEQDKHLQAGLSDFRQSVIAAEAKREIEDRKSAQFRLDTQSALDGIRRDAKNFSSDTSNRLDQISADTSSMQMSLVSINDLGRQIVAFLSSFPVEMRDLLRKVHSMNLQMYYILRQQSRTIPTSPELQHGKIDLLDCMGRQFELPYEWFCRWEVLQGLLRTELRNVTDEEYELYNTTDNCQLVRKEDWSSVRPGSKIYMAMVIPQLQWEIGTCPRPSCRRAIDTESGNLRACPHCGLRFLFFNHPDDTLDEGSRVSQLQGEEDYALFGARKPLVDTPAIMEHQSSRISSIYSDGSSSAPLDEIQISGHQPQSLNPTPLDSWLTRVEPPNVPLEPVHEQHMAANDAEQTEGQQLEEFKIISIKANPIPRSEFPRADDGPSVAEADGSEDMPFAARIYYRNILDRFPRLSGPLARRCAMANLRRAQRLQMARGETDKDIKADPTMTRSSIDEENPNALSPPLSLEVVRAGADKPGPDPIFQLSNPHSEGGAPKGSIVEYSFWTGREINPRPPSNSGSSSMNSSLQSGGPPGQRSDNSSTSSSIDQPLPNMVLPPPPVELGSHQSLVCDICGKNVHIVLRKEWRKHVLGDLQPYMCSFENCNAAGKLYATRKEWFAHEKKRHRTSTKYHCPETCEARFNSVSDCKSHLRRVHKFQKWQIRGLNMRGLKQTTTTAHSSYCTFCGTHQKDPSSVARHVGRHLEELAFIILAKQYEEWDFRDDDTAADNLSYSSRHARNIERAFQRGDLRALFELQKQGYDTIPSEEVLRQTWDGVCLGTYPEKDAHAIVWYLLRNGVQPPVRFIQWAIECNNKGLVTMLLKADPQISSKFVPFSMDIGAYDIVEMFLVASKDAGCQLYMEDVVESFLRHHREAPRTIHQLLQLLTTRKVDLINSCVDCWHMMLHERNYLLVNRFLELTQSPQPVDLFRALNGIVGHVIPLRHTGSECQIFTPPKPGSREDLISKALTTHVFRIAAQKEINTTVLCLAAINASFGVVHYLLHMGCDPNEPDADGRLPLQEAILECNFITARLLFASGARIDIGGDEQVVFDYASSFTDLNQTWAERVAEFMEYCPRNIVKYSHRSMCSSCDAMIGRLPKKH